MGTGLSANQKAPLCRLYKGQFTQIFAAKFVADLSKRLMLNQKSVSGKDFGLIIINEYYNNIIQMLNVAIIIATKIARVNRTGLKSLNYVQPTARNSEIPRLYFG